MNSHRGFVWFPIVLFVALIAIASGLYVVLHRNATEPSVSALGTYSTFTTQQYGFSIQYPKTLTPDTSRSTPSGSPRHTEIVTFDDAPGAQPHPVRGHLAIYYVEAPCASVPPTTPTSTPDSIRQTDRGSIALNGTLFHQYTTEVDGNAHGIPGFAVANDYNADWMNGCLRIESTIEGGGTSSANPDPTQKEILNRIHAEFDALPSSFRSL